MTTQLTTTPTSAVPGPLFAPVQLGVGASTLLTVAASHTRKVLSVSLTNVAKTAGVTVTLYFVEDGGSAGDSNTYLAAATIPSDGVPWHISLPVGGRMLGAGQTIQAKASVATTITIMGSGIDYA
jgi:hypothetical protein